MRVLSVMERAFSSLKNESTKILYIESLQKLRKKPELREQEKEKICDFLSKVNTFKQQEPESRFVEGRPMPYAKESDILGKRTSDYRNEPNTDLKKK